MPDPMVNIHYAKTHLSRLLEQVRAGERVTIASAGVPVARLVPLTGEAGDAPPSRPMVRETVTPYRASPPVEPSPRPRTVTARAFAERWGTLPRLAPDEAAAMARDLGEARAALPPVSPPWE